MEVVPSTKRPQRKTDPALIYFLVCLILFLIGTNVLTYLSQSHVNQVKLVKVIQQSDEHSGMEDELDALSLDLATTSKGKIKLDSTVDIKERELADGIYKLKRTLHGKKLSKAEILAITRQIPIIRASIIRFKSGVVALRARNQALAIANIKLRRKADSVHRKSSALENRHALLSKKVTEAAALKTSEITISPLKVKSNGKEVAATRVSKVNKIRISFSIIDNALSKEGARDIYLVLTDPSGEVVTGDSTGSFETYDGESLDYTSRTSISYLRSTKSYCIDWTKDDDLIPGPYLTELYADGFKMGSTNFTLKKKGLF